MYTYRTPQQLVDDLTDADINYQAKIKRELILSNNIVNRWLIIDDAREIAFNTGNILSLNKLDHLFKLTNQEKDVLEKASIFARGDLSSSYPRLLINLNKR